MKEHDRPPEEPRRLEEPKRPEEPKQDRPDQRAKGIEVSKEAAEHNAKRREKDAPQRQGGAPEGLEFPGLVSESKQRLVPEKKFDQDLQGSRGEKEATKDEFARRNPPEEREGPP